MDNSNRTFVSSILFLDIVEYSKQSVTDQLALKQRFNTLLVDSLKHVALSDRIVLDTGDGAAVSFQGNPEDSLFAAMHLRDAIASTPASDLPRLEVRFGINLGPVRLIKDINGQLNIIGDGINVAQRVMSFADAGAILVSRSYFEVVSRLSDDYAKIFSAAGTRTDKHVREHSVYEIGKSIAGLIEPFQGAATVAPAKAESGARPEVAPVSRPPGGNRKMFVAAALGAVVLLGIAYLAGSRRDIPPEPASATVAPKMTAAVTRDKPANTVVATAKADLPTAPATMAQTKIAVVLAIKPWGEVYIDGKMKGVSPPLKSIALTPGTHVVEIRNTTFPNFMKTLTLKPGDTPRIEYKF